MKRTKTFTIEYNYFEPGTYVVPTSPRCVLTHEDRTLFEVIDCLEPTFAGETSLVFVKGRFHGVDTTYLREATQEEIAEGR